MHYPGTFVILVLIGCIMLAGCTQPAGTSPVSSPVRETMLPAPGAAVNAAVAASVPEPVVTIVRYVSATRTVKDSGRLFALDIPVEWNVTTREQTRSGSPYYWTDLGSGSVFTIDTYTFTKDQDQAYRDAFRQWSPAPVVTPVTINNVVFDRFESSSAGKTSVAYVAQKISANERGFTSVIVFVANESNRFEKEDFEKVVLTFRYISGGAVGDEPGEEIPVYDTAGKVVPVKDNGLDPRMFDTSDWDSGGSDSDSSSSGGDSSDDGGCGCGGGP